MQCVINGVSFEKCNSNNNILFVDSYEEVYFDVLNLKIGKDTIVAELVENTTTGPLVRLNKLVVGNDSYKEVLFLVVKEKADIKVHLNESNILSTPDYNLPAKIDLTKSSQTPKLISESSSYTDINKIKEQALQSIRKEKENLELLKEDLDKANNVISEQIEEYKVELLQNFYNATNQNKDEIATHATDVIQDLIESLTTKVNQQIDNLQSIVSDNFDKKKVNIDSDIENSKNSLRNELSNVFEQFKSSTIVALDKDYDVKIDAAVDKFLKDKKDIIEEKFTQVRDKAVKQQFENLVKSEWGRKEPELMTRIRTMVSTLLERSGGGGGSVAVQYANGGIMNGSLNIASGSILSGGRDLFTIFTTSTANGGGGGGDNTWVIANSALILGDLTNIASTSATWNTAYTNVVNNSAAYLAGGGGGGDNTWSIANSALILGDLTNIASTSATWNTAYTNVINNSAAYLSSINLTNLALLSGNWNTSYTFNNTTSALILGDITNVSNISGNWNVAYTNVINNSAAYLSSINLTNLALLSANWNTSYTYDLATSGLYQGNLTNIANTSANWNVAYTNVINNSAAYLSAVSLTNLALLSSNWNTSYTFLTSNSALILGDLTNIANTSANWNIGYTNVATNSGSYATKSYVNSTFVYNSGGNIDGSLGVAGNLTVYGAITALSGLTIIGTTTFSSTSSLSVINTGPGPAFFVKQSGIIGDVASFYDSAGEVLHIGNRQDPSPGLIGINTNDPNTTLTVVGDISATGVISTSSGNSTNWNTSYSYSNSTSGLVLGYLTNIASTSATWNTAYTNVLNNSAAYLSGIDLTNLALLSGNWNTSYTFNNTTSALILGDLTNIASTSANWNTSYTFNNTTSALILGDLTNIANTSATWNDSYTFHVNQSALILGDLTDIASTSANWNAAYTNVINNSAAYLSAVSLTTGVTGVLPLSSGGTNSTSAGQATARLNPTTSMVTTSATTVTLTNSSFQGQIFTGFEPQTVILPVTNTLEVGWRYIITNNAISNVTVQSSGANTVLVLASGMTGTFVCKGTTLTTAADWNYYVSGVTTYTGTGDLVLGANPTLSADLRFSGNFTIYSLSTAASMFIGATNSNGTITIGRATGSSTLNLGGGVTSSGITSTINIGTAGAAGSTTTIRIGSSANTSTITHNGVNSFNSGTSSLPSIYFANDTTSGLYRIGSNNIGVAISGNKIIDIASTGVAISGSVSDAIGDVRLIPQNSQSTTYTTVSSDSGKHIYHPASDVTARTFTIPSNSNLPYPIGTAITFINQNGAGTITLSAADTLRFAGTGATGTRTLTANGIATAIKVLSAEWIISGTGLT